MTMDLYAGSIATKPVAERDFLVFLMRGGAVARFHNCATTNKQSVAAHSFGVIWLVWMLSEGKPSQNLIMAAAAHDLAEQVAGDIPAPAKMAGNGAVAKLLDKLENDVLRTYGVEFPLTTAEERVLKVADKLDGCLYCIYERMQGNKFVEFTYSKFMEYARKLRLENFEREVLIFEAVEDMWKEAVA